MENPKIEIEKLAHDAGRKIGNMANHISSSASEYAGSSRQYIHEHPIKSVATAAAVGVVVGSILTLTLRRRDK